MPYDYKVQKGELAKVLDYDYALVITAFVAKTACSVAGVVLMETLTKVMSGTMDQWNQLAVVDRLRELGLLSEVQQEAGVAGQHRIFRWVGP